MRRYDIYEKEGAVFRGRSGSHFVTEIQVGDDWQPYDGDPMRPVVFGDYLHTEDETGTDLREYPHPSRLASAVSYAALIHGAQKRKGTAIPYVSHLMSVCALVMENGGDEDQAIAGLLHDVLEDCGAHQEQVIHDNWGERGAKIVRDCTDGVPDQMGKKGDWRERKKAYLDHLRTVDRASLLVSACDKLHNARAIVADLAAGHDVFSRFKAGRDGTLWYYKELVGVFGLRFGAKEPVLRQLSSAVSAMGSQ
jgi:(p)ppGpp synthase/HD superfamily hydrolase